jgi:predicted O-methyltransferase YrrM
MSAGDSRRLCPLPIGQGCSQTQIAASQGHLIRMESPMPTLSYSRIQEHLLSLVPSRDPEMVSMEKYAEEKSFPIIGPSAGYTCYQLARLIGAHSVFEMGSGFGYSTAWFARAVKENGGGIVHHVVWDQELSERARGHLSKLGLGDLVEYHVSEAVGTLREAAGPFDLIFNDIDKQEYPVSLPVIKQKLRRGGLLITDNLLWHGRIFDGKDHSPATEGVRDFTRLITQDPDWIVSLLPVRDGLAVAYLK